MKENELKFIDSNFKTINLIKVNYIDLDKVDSQAKIVTHDDYRIIKCTSKEVEIEFTRRVYFEPKSILESEIVLRIEYNTIKEAEQLEIEKEIRENLFNLLTPLASRASLIFGVISYIHLENPMIDPPFPLIKESSLNNYDSISSE